MKIKDFELYSFCLPLIKPLQLKNTLLKNREGYIIILKDFLGNIGFGEISPLAGFHKESLFDVLNELKELKKTVINNSFNIEQKLFNSITNQSCKNELFKINADNPIDFNTLTPSVRFGFESSILNLVSEINNKPLCEILNPKSNNTIIINALITSDIKRIKHEAKMLIKEQCQTVKLKIGTQGLKNDINNIKTVRDIMGNKVKIRLDANRLYSLQDAVIVGKSVYKENIEYIEEPINNTKNLNIFYQETGIKTALDETLLEKNCCDLTEYKGVSAYILKPSILGGINKTVSLALTAKKAGINTVITSMFESCAGLYLLAHISAALANKGTACGLSTYSWFNNSSIYENFKVTNWKIDINALIKSQNSLNFKQLKRINI